MTVVSKQADLKFYHDNKDMLIRLLNLIPAGTLEEASVHLMNDKVQGSYMDMQLAAVQSLIQAVSEPIKADDIEFSSEFVGYKTRIDSQGVIRKDTVMRDEFYLKDSKKKV